MRKLFLVGALALALPIIAQAQDSPRTEIFGGYSYIHLDEDLSNDRDLNGYNASVTQTIFKRWLAFKADFSGHFGDSAVTLGPGTDFKKFLFLFGPQFTLRRHERIQPFVHVLFGVSRIDLNNDTNGLSFDDTAFAMAAGGGVDVKVADRLAVRLFQADYVLTRFGDTNQGNFRASGGFVLRFGRVE